MFAIIRSIEDEDLHIHRTVRSYLKLLNEQPFSLVYPFVGWLIGHCCCHSIVLLIADQLSFLEYTVMAY